VIWVVDVWLGGKNEFVRHATCQTFYIPEIFRIGTCHSVKFLYSEPIELHHGFFAFFGGEHTRLLFCSVVPNEKRWGQRICPCKHHRASVHVTIDL